MRVVVWLAATAGALVTKPPWLISGRSGRRGGPLLRRRGEAAPRKMSAEDNLEAWERVKEFHAGAWRGRCERVWVDGVLRKAGLEGEKRAYEVTSTPSDKGPTLSETILWDEGGEETRTGRDLSGDLDASYSVDFNVPHPKTRFAAELTFALGASERVRVGVHYDQSGYMSRVEVMDEARLGASNVATAGAKRSDRTNLYSMVGDWSGDATVRRRRGQMAVAKQNVRYSTDGDRVLRCLTIADAAGVTVHDTEAFGAVLPAENPGVDLVVFDDGATLIHLHDAALYALAPLSLDQGTAFHIEAGLFVNEDPDLPNAQFPISVRGVAPSSSSDDDSLLPDNIGTTSPDTVNSPDDSSTTPKKKLRVLRHLVRAVRLYDGQGALASVTTSYHRHHTAL